MDGRSAANAGSSLRPAARMDAKDLDVAFMDDSFI
jgi:hypothetical protein